MRISSIDTLQRIRSELDVIDWVKTKWPEYQGVKPGSNRERLLDELLLEALPELGRELFEWAGDERERLESLNFGLHDEIEVLDGYNQWTAGKVTVINEAGFVVGGHSYSKDRTRPLASELEELTRLRAACAVLE